MRRQKASFYDLYDIDVEYSTTYNVKNSDGLTGIFYKLDKPLTEVQKTFLEQFKNVSYGHSRSQYAPEQVNTAVILWSKKIR